MRKIIVLGATSAIAIETARYFAADGAELVLVARDEGKLKVLADDLRARGAKQVSTKASDLADISGHEKLLSWADQTLGQFNTLLIAYGVLGDQTAEIKSYSQTLANFQTNFLSPISILTLAANILESRGVGDIAVIGSVAGDRGRQSNYVYGTAKGGLAIFLQGLRHRLAKTKVNVLTIKPGFVDTPMTDHIKKGPLFATPQTVGRDIYKAILSRRAVLYTPWFWCGIMLIIKHVPEFIFKRTKL